jgi:hypothetical protein
VFVYDTDSKFPAAWRYNAIRSRSTTNTALGAAHVFTSRWSGSINTMYQDGTSFTAVAATETFASNQLLLCAGAADLNEGYGSIPATVCELVWYTDAKSAGDRGAIEAYLKAKWGTP